MLRVQFSHPTATCAFLERVLTADVHDHLHMIGLVDVELLPHGPQKLIFARRNNPVFENHFNHVPIVLHGREVAMVQHHAALFCDDVRPAGVVDKNHE